MLLYKILFCGLLLLPFLGKAQISNLQEKFNLPNALGESSGAIFYNQKIITHNDSGNSNQLYELDTISGQITRTITIANATNVDWEDLAQDQNHIYIGDFGNNSGNRTDLKIYKILKNDFLASNSVNAEVINFQYQDQTNFTPNFNNTEWDAEALIAYEDQLIVFTKNWVNQSTKAYPIPKNSGSYSVSPMANSLLNSGLITGATYNSLTGKLYLVGYTSILQPFVWIVENFTANNIFSGTNTQIPLSSLGFEQTEAIAHVSANRFMITSESFSNAFVSDLAKLVAFSTNDPLLSNQNQNQEKLSIYPNPVQDYFTIKGLAVQLVEVYNAHAQLVFRGKSNRISLVGEQKGVYFAKIMLEDKSYCIKKIIKQ